MSIESFVPESVDVALTAALPSLVSPSVSEFVREREAAGWKFYVVIQSRGRCYYRSLVITLPVWALKREIEYRDWYVSHEIAHTFAIGHSHDKLFMEALVRICPARSLYFELGYKLKAASSVGIKKPAKISANNAKDAL